MDDNIFQMFMTIKNGLSARKFMLGCKNTANQRIIGDNFDCVIYIFDSECCRLHAYNFSFTNGYQIDVYESGCQI